MTRLFAQNLLKYSLQILRERLGILFLTGWICGVYLFSCIQRFQAFVGDSPEVFVGMGLAVAIGIWLGLPASAALSNRESESTTESNPDVGKMSITFFVLSLWSLCFPMLLNQLNQVLHLVTVQQISNFVFLTGLMTLAAMALIMPAVFWCSRLFWLTAKNTGFDLNTSLQLNRHVARYLTGIGLALITAAYWIVPLFGWNVSLILPVGMVFVLCCGPWILAYAKPYLPETPQWLKVDSAKAELEPLFKPSENDQRESASIVPLMIRGCSFPVSLAVGILFVMLSRVLFQLYPDSLYLKVTIWAAFLCGIGAAFSFIRSRGITQQIQTAACLSLGTGIIGVSCLALFPLLVSCMLYANAYIEIAQILAVVRGGLTAIVFSLLGWCWGGWLNLAIQTRQMKTDPFTIYTLPVWQPFCFLAGIFFSFWLIGGGIADVKTIIVLTSLGLLCLTAVVWFSHLRIPKTRFQLSMGIFSLAVLILGFVFHQNYDVRHSAKLLFAT
ncbi:hypothetical protein, partial [uncultured Gimesia sp.]|uniref:hypothetical protein n=1 Tax=uncultured Gimesia sp. TaxID=1678688 RepID=UPI0026341ED3